ncbi:MAG TPA: ATP-binding protein [Roseiarcus sp.]|nr:ATP-binding protein [Roseiarcus sp.]
MGRPQMVSRDFPGTLEAASEAEAWLMSQSGALGLAPDAEFAINLCVEELFLNAVWHGRANRAKISISSESGGVRVEFVDDGAPFDPIAAPARRIRARNEDFQIGGYGTGLLQKFSRRISYNRDDDHNRLVLEFDANAG